MEKQYLDVDEQNSIVLQGHNQPIAPQRNSISQLKWNSTFDDNTRSPNQVTMVAWLCRSDSKQQKLATQYHVRFLSENCTLSVDIFYENRPIDWKYNALWNFLLLKNDADWKLCFTLFNRQHFEFFLGQPKFWQMKWRHLMCSQEDTQLFCSRWCVRETTFQFQLQCRVTCSIEPFFIAAERCSLPPYIKQLTARRHSDQTNKTLT